MMREVVTEEPGLIADTRVDVEILKNHLMKAKISMPSAGAEFTIFSDEPPIIGGEGAAPLMFGYFMAGTLLCECAQYIWNAAQLELIDSISSLKMSIEGGFPIAPLYGMDDTKGEARVKEMKVTTTIEGDASPEQIEELARLAVRRCPAHQTILNPTPYVNVVVLNGNKIAEFRDADR
jgi:hypothetical protein